MIPNQTSNLPDNKLLDSMDFKAKEALKLSSVQSNRTIKNFKKW